MADVEELFSHLGESNKNCLGFSQEKPRGNGKGTTDVLIIFRGHKENPVLRTGISVPLWFYWDRSSNVW